jgi:hypothetical protein
VAQAPSPVALLGTELTRLAVWIVLLIAASSTYALNKSNQQQRWRTAHWQLMAQMQGAMRGRSAQANPEALRALPPELANQYPVGIDLAQKRYTARKQCLKLATEGINVFCSLGEELVEGKRDGITTYNVAKQFCETLEDANQQYLDAHLQLTNWQGEAFAAWNEIWPRHDLNLSLKGSALNLEVDTNKLAKTQRKVQLKQDQVFAPYKSGQRYNFPDGFDRRNTECFGELFAINNAVFDAELDIGDHGAAYITNYTQRDNWFKRVLSRKQTAPVGPGSVIAPSYLPQSSSPSPGTP